MADPVQTTFNRYMSEGVAGMPATMHGWDIDSKLCASASIGFGLAVSQGDADAGVVLGAPSGRDFVGISVRDITLVHATPDRYEEGDNTGIMVGGDIWVTVTDEDAVKGEAAKFDTTTGAIQGSGGGGTEIPTSRFMTSAVVGELAVLRITEPDGAGA